MNGSELLNFFCKISFGIKTNSESLKATADKDLSSDSNKIYHAPNVSPGPISPMCSIILAVLYFFLDELNLTRQYKHHRPLDLEGK